MKRENTVFLLGGVFIGFILGAVFAHFLLRPPAPALFQTAPPAPAAASAEPDDGQAMRLFQERVDLLAKALKESPQDAALLGRMGDLYYDAGMFDRAADYYLRSLEIEPGNPNISTDLGVCFHRQGRNEEAIERFRASIAIDPGHWQSWLNLGIVSLFANRDAATAEEAFDRVRELNPSFEGLPQLQQALDRVKAGGTP